MNTIVQDKSGDELVNIISENVGRMLRRKMDAVTCIRIAAESNSENNSSESEEYNSNFTYFSGKYSQVIGESPSEIPDNMLKNKNIYR